MSCNFSSIDSVMECYRLAEPFFTVGTTILGVGSGAGLGLIIWVFKRLKRDLMKVEEHNKNLILSKDEMSKDLALTHQLRDAATQEINRMQELLRQSDKPAEALQEANRKLDSVRMACKGVSENFWARERTVNYDSKMRDSIPIMLFANQKGGVGKTTTASNIAAYFSAQGERVLVIDLDYQGSLSAIMLRQNKRTPGEFPSKVEHIFANKYSETWHQAAIDELYLDKGMIGSLHYITAWYQFEFLERCIEYSWALQDVEDDVRFRLARALQSDYIQQNYDRVILDGPPRLTIGFVNGFCAATHLFVPSQIDSTSLNAVISFARVYIRLIVLNPFLKFSGVIGTMTSKGPTLPNVLEGKVEKTNVVLRGILQTEESLFIKNAVVKQSVHIRNGLADGIPYFKNSNAREIYGLLGQEIARRAPSKDKNAS